MKKKISDKDKKDWENFLSSKGSLPNKDLELNIKKEISTKKIDLHGYSLEDANKKIEKVMHRPVRHTKLGIRVTEYQDE